MHAVQPGGELAVTAVVQLTVQGRAVATDAEGYLARMDDWSEAVCEAMAAADQCALSEEHWKVIRFLREFYAEYRISPATRVLMRAIAGVLGEEKANSQYLYRLFPYGPAKQAFRYAGLPKPANCI